MNVWMIYDSDVRKRFFNYYWSAPDQYVGNKLTSYGSVLRVSIIWSVQRGDTSGEPVFNPDIIIAVGFFSYVCVYKSVSETLRVNDRESSGGRK